MATDNSDKEESSKLRLGRSRSWSLEIDLVDQESIAF